jgi:hypothetical protein
MLVGQAVRGDADDVALLSEVGEQAFAFVGDGMDVPRHRG